MDDGAGDKIVMIAAHAAFPPFAVAGLTSLAQRYANGTI